jgi:hypothetical protein
VERHRALVPLPIITGVTERPLAQNIDYRVQHTMLEIGKIKLPRTRILALWQEVKACHGMNSGRKSRAALSLCCFQNFQNKLKMAQFVFLSFWQTPLKNKKKLRQPVLVL